MTGLEQKLYDFFKGKRVLILGFGREGKTTLDILQKIPCEIGVASQKINDEDKQLISDLQQFIGDDYLKACDEYDIIMQSPGVIIKDYISDANKVKITSQTDLMLRFAENKIIGITGTKGKSTTSSLIHHFIKASGFKTTLIGNIGIPPLSGVLDIDEETIVVCEMSCHQLEFVKASPNIAVLLNVFEEHLDHYTGFDAYRHAKENIFRYQGINDTLIVNVDCETDEIRSLSSNRILAAINEPADISVRSPIEQINVLGYRYEFSQINTQLMGEYNKYNIAVALGAAYEAGCSMSVSLASLPDFIPLEHRLEKVAVIDGAEYINDSICTTPYATIATVKAFDAVDTLIIGGMDRDISYDVLVDFLEKGTVQNLIFLPDTGYRIADQIKNLSLNIYKAKDMVEAVAAAKKVTKVRCILSPAAASYGFYQNFEERGRHFKALIKGAN